MCRTGIKGSSTQLQVSPGVEDMVSALWLLQTLLFTISSAFPALSQVLSSLLLALGHFLPSSSAPSSPLLLSPLTHPSKDLSHRGEDRRFNPFVRPG